jgi:hypothetical protein
MQSDSDEDSDYDRNPDYDDPGDEQPERLRGRRFGEGQPINRGGRPRGSPNFATMAKRVAGKRHKVMIDGRLRHKSTLELVILALKRKAASGDIFAIDIVQDLSSWLEPRKAIRSAVLITGEDLTPDEWQAVFGNDVTDEEVEQRFPYLMRMRRANQLYNSKQKEREDQLAAASKAATG